MKKFFLFVILLFSFSSIHFTFAQNIVDEIFKDKTEIYFNFNVADKWEINSLTKVISIDEVNGAEVYAYANRKEFTEFLKLNYNYKILPHPGTLINPEMSDDIDEIAEWDSYPTYDAYVNMMNMFSINYPGICKIVDAGTTIQGRKILFAVISDNVMIHEAEPQFMFSSSMHGDETTGYVLMLRLIDSLLSTYSTDARINNLVNNLEIWINPLGNPDGTYRTGNSTVNGATRYNANNIDINRNFPDPADGPHPDGNAWQPETIAMMNLAYANNFVLSANFHGGTEVVNYPWDTWARLHADDSWWQYISHLYADTCQANSPSNYMNGYNDGITNGYAWYRITGGRQDFFTYFANGRELTVEISDTKLLSPSLLPAHWNYNRKSFLRYMEHSLHGIRGLITDTTGNPLKAKITVLSHDMDSSFVYSDSLTGVYTRMIFAGTYNLKITAPGYYDQIINGVTVQNLTPTILDIELVPTSVVPVELSSFSAEIADHSVVLKWSTSSELNNAGFELQRNSDDTEWDVISFINGAGTTTEIQNYTFADENLSSGKYQYRLRQIDFSGSYTFSEVIEIEILSPDKFSLHQNYPNPFNPATKIKYSLDENDNMSLSNQWVSLKVYDILGNEIATLVNEEKPAGVYEVEFNSTANMASGFYIYRLVVNGNSFTRKMMLLK
ncbi:MAG: T9SS type A sorting domain-containing protein [Ignavibacteriales bacterium]|nr:MAG: T9SS type A sorting domain-containing protein [Ignavibacteriales bacterium]